MGTSLTSEVTIINFMTGIGYDIVWTGTPTGTFSVEVSNTYSLDAAGKVANAGNWTAVDLSGPIVAAGTPDNAFINMAGLEAYAIRLVYTRTSGTGTLNATVCGKVQ
jgi:hypothetical protein